MVTRQNVSRRQFLSGVAGTAGKEQIVPPPQGLDHDRWIGPAPYTPYRVALLPKNWRWVLDCIRSRKETIAPCETAHRSATPGHLGRIAMWLGRKIRFNPEIEEIIGDPTATQMLGRAYRSPWYF